MPLYEYHCDCGCEITELQPMGGDTPGCPDCGVLMARTPTYPARVKMGPPLWTGRVDDIHKAQEQRGERLRFVHPGEVQ